MRLRLTGAIILKMSHGYTIEPEKPDPLVMLADDTLLEFSLSAQAGAWLVDVLPFSKISPSSRFVAFLILMQCNTFPSGSPELVSNVSPGNGDLTVMS